MTAPADGGAGLGAVEAAIALEELGSHLVPGPLVWSILAATLAGRRGRRWPDRRRPGCARPRRRADPRRACGRPRHPRVAAARRGLRVQPGRAGGADPDAGPRSADIDRPVSGAARGRPHRRRRRGRPAPPPGHRPHRRPARRGIGHGSRDRPCLRTRARAVRREDRFLPSDQTPAGRHVRAHEPGPQRDLCGRRPPRRGRDEPTPSRTRSGAGRPGREAAGRRGGNHQRQSGRADPRRDGLHAGPWSRTTCSSGRGCSSTRSARPTPTPWRSAPASGRRSADDDRTRGADRRRRRHRSGRSGDRVWWAMEDLGRARHHDRGRRPRRPPARRRRRGVAAQPPGPRRHAARRAASRRVPGGHQPRARRRTDPRRHRRPRSRLIWPAAPRISRHSLDRTCGPRSSRSTTWGRPSPSSRAGPGRHPDRPGVAVRMLTSGTTGPPKRVDLTYQDARARPRRRQAL